MQRTFKKNQPIKEEWGSPDPNHQGGQFKKMSNWYFFINRLFHNLYLLYQFETGNEL